MGIMPNDQDPLASIPKNVRDKDGRIIGFYFPASRRLRFMDGATIAVDKSGRFREGNAIRVIDLTNLTLINKIVGPM